jgi:hypothetical protein
MDTKIEYEKNNNFLTLKLPLHDVKLIKAVKLRKYFIKIEDPSGKYNLICSKEDRIGQLADLIGIGRKIFKSYIRNGEVDDINEIIQSSSNADKIIQIKTSTSDNEDYWIYAFSTELHETVTFTQIGNIVNRMLPRIEESTFNGVKVWEMKHKTIECEELKEKFDILLRVTSGTNTKSSAMHVILYVKVGSCDNSIRCTMYRSIKRTKNWEENLTEKIKTAVKLMHTIEETLKKSREYISLEEGLEYIDKFKLPNNLKQNKDKIKQLLRSRFIYEYNTKGLQNKFAMSQALSYVGTHEKHDYLSDYASNVLQYEAFRYLTH